MPGFYIDVYNAAGVKENGTTIDVMDVKRIDRVSKIGEVTFSLPAEVATSQGFAFGKQYKIYSQVSGSLGTYYHRTLEYDADNMVARIAADDSLKLLSDFTTPFNLTYGVGYRLKPLITNVISRFNTASGKSWTVAYETLMDNPLVSYDAQGETFLQVLEAARSFTRGFFRRTTDTSILFGRFYNVGLVPTIYDHGGATIYGQKRYGFAPDDFDMNEVAAEVSNIPILSNRAETRLGSALTLVTKLRTVMEGSNVINRIYPVGSGEGQTQLTLYRAAKNLMPGESVPYDIKTITNPDGSINRFYIEDTTSQGLYGIVERTVPFNDIRPITNSEADIIQASRCLYVAASAFLRNFSYPSEVYELECVGLPSTALVGDLILLDFRGVVEKANGNLAYLTVSNRPFFIVEKETSWDQEGVPKYRLTISTNGEGDVQITDVMASVMQDIEKFKVHPDPTQTYVSAPSPTLPITNTIPVTFRFTIGTNVLYVNELKIRFSVMPLRSLSGSAAAGGASTTSAGGGGAYGGAAANENASHSHFVIVYLGASGSPVYLNGGTLLSNAAAYNPNYSATSSDSAAHTHNVSVTLPNHDHQVPSHTHALEFGIFDDTNTPKQLSLKLNGAPLLNIHRDDASGTIVGNTITERGNFWVNLLYDAALQPDGIRSDGAFETGGGIQGNYDIQFACVAETPPAKSQGQLFAWLDGRYTIQPIQVV